MSMLRVVINNFSKSTYEKTIQEIIKTKKRVEKYLKSEASTPYDFIKVPHDNNLHQTIEEFEQTVIKPSLIVIIGIGGSNLGAMAIEQALRGVYSNLLEKPRILFADTVDTLFIVQQKKIIESVIKNGESVAFVAITKSGKTTETIALFEFFIGLYEQYGFFLKSSILVITEQHSSLASLAKKKNFRLFEIPTTVGGRFSVFTAVGLIVCALVGINWRELIDGARSVNNLFYTSDDDIVVLHAAFIAMHYQHGARIHDLFLFANQLELVGKWYRQLMGESLGKSEARSGTKKSHGILPTVSIGSTDLHSVGQLYLSGYQHRMTTFIAIEKVDPVIYVPQFFDFESCVEHIQGASLKDISDALFVGACRAYADQGLPYCTLFFPEISPYFIGQYMQFAMLEMIYLADILDIDPFNQPHVELYKLHTRKFLAHE